MSHARLEPFLVEISSSGWDHILQIFSIVLSAATLFLWWSTNRLVKSTKRSSRIEMRPWIFHRDFEFTLINDPSGVPMAWAVRVIWKNSGHSFPQNMHNNIHFDFLGVDEEHSSNFPSISTYTNESHPTLFVAPNETMPGGSVLIPISNFLDAQAGRKKIYLRGWAQYCDSYKPKVDSYRTEFCLELFTRDDPKRAGCAFTYGFHLNHTRTDNEIAKSFMRINLGGISKSLWNFSRRLLRSRTRN